MTLAEGSTDAQSSIQTRLVFESYGLRVLIDLADPELLAPVLEDLPPGTFGDVNAEQAFDRSYQILCSAEGAATGYRLVVDSVERPATIASPTLTAQHLEADLKIYLAEFADPHLFLHAGVVQWYGKVVVLPGSSFAGKSTLTRALVNEGATYFSDEFAVLDHEGRVLPYARKLSQREGPLGPIGRIDLQAHAPVISDGFVPPPVDLVALLRYEKGSEWQVTPIKGGEAVLALSEHMVPIRRRPADTLSMLAKVAGHAEVYRGTRSDLDSAITWIRDRLTRE